MSLGVSGHAAGNITLVQFVPERPPGQLPLHIVDDVRVCLLYTSASIGPTLFKMDFSVIGSLDFLVVVFAFLFVDLFDTLGTLIGCASKANMLDAEGRLPGIKGALLADAIGTTAGACLGTSTITTFVESSSGIAEGGRTGMTAIVSLSLIHI